MEPIPQGLSAGGIDQMTMVEGGIIISGSDTPAPDATTSVAGRRRAGGGRMRDDPLAGIEQELVAKWSAIESLRSKMEMHLHSKTDDYEITTEGGGTRESLRIGGKTLMRSTFGSGITIVAEDADPPTRQTGQRVNKVFDGEFLYTQIETHEGARATKRLVTPQSFMAVGGPGLINVLRGLRKLMRAADTEIDGRSMYVFTGYNPVNVSITYMIEKESGLLFSVERVWRVADRTRRFKFIEHEINPVFPPDYFTFVPSEGVKVEDRTRTEEGSPAIDPQP